MRVTICAKIERANGTQEMVEVFRLERAANAAPSSGLGLLLRESRELAAALQSVVLREQVQEVTAAMSRCPSCSAALGVKDSKRIVYRTAFGKVRCASPRLYAYCSSCGARAHQQATFSPLAMALPERTHPQWAWLQTRYASVMSYRWARTFLAHSFSGADELPASSVRKNVLRVGGRLEAEMQRRIDSRLREIPVVDNGPAPDVSQAPHALQVDAGYVRSVRQAEGTGWISVIASKVVRPESRRTHAHAYSIGYEPMQGMRQQAFLASVGIGYDMPVTVLSDGGEDVGSAGSLGNRCERVLDWFHIGMKFEHLQLALIGLKGLDPAERQRLRRNTMGAKWLLWHGEADRCLDRLAVLRRDTGWTGKPNALGKLIVYLGRGRPWLTNYASRRARGLPISSAGAESAVDHVVGQRMKSNGHMRWTRRGANSLLQVRCAVLNGQDVRNFKRWYPPSTSIQKAA